MGPFERLCFGNNYVDLNAATGGNGSTCVITYTDLQAALDLVADCEIDSILVAEGTYYPS